MYHHCGSRCRPTSSIPRLVLSISIALGLGVIELEAEPLPLPTARLHGHPVDVELIAGSGDIGDGGPATEAVLAGVGGLVVDVRGNIYLSEASRNRVRRIDASSGAITTVAGSGLMYNIGDSNKLHRISIQAPGPMAIDAAARYLYVGEIVGRRVRRIDLKEGEIKDLGVPEGGFGLPAGLLWTSSGLLVIDSAKGQVYQEQGEGWKALLPDGAKLQGGIRAATLDPAGRLYLVEYFSHRIVRWDGEQRILEVVIGTGESGRGEGPATEAKIRTPDGIASDAAGNIYFSDMGNRRICRVDARTGHLETLFESGPTGSADRWTPGPMARDAQGRLYVGDLFRNLVMRFSPGNRKPEILGGGGHNGDGGPALAARLLNPHAIFLDPTASRLYVASAVSSRLRQIDLRNGLINKVPIDDSVSPHLVFHAVTRWKDGLVLAVPRPSSNHASGIHFLDKEGRLQALVKHPDIYFAQDVATSPDGELFIAETGRNRIVRLAEDGQLEVVVEPLGRPRSINFDHNGDLLISDTFHNRILKVKFSNAKKQIQGRKSPTPMTHPAQTPRVKQATPRTEQSFRR